jgi:hypothetical protein
VDQGTLVEIPVDDGRRFVTRFAADGNPVQAAFWAKTDEEGLWFLYVVSALYDSAGPAAAYRAVHESFQKLAKSSIFTSQIKVIGPNNPIAKDVLVFTSRYPGRYMSGTATVGSTTLDQVFIYPTHVFTFAQASPMTSEQVEHEILRLMKSPTPKWSQVTLRDGTAFRGVASSIERGAHNMTVVRFCVDETFRSEPLDDIVSIKEVP